MCGVKWRIGTYNATVVLTQERGNHSLRVRKIPQGSAGVLPASIICAKNGLKFFGKVAQICWQTGTRSVIAAFIPSGVLEFCQQTNIERKSGLDAGTPLNIASAQIGSHHSSLSLYI